MVKESLPLLIALMLPVPAADLRLPAPPPQDRSAVVLPPPAVPGPVAPGLWLNF